MEFARFSPNKDKRSIPRSSARPLQPVPALNHILFIFPPAAHLLPRYDKREEEGARRKSANHVSAGTKADLSVTGFGFLQGLDLQKPLGVVVCSLWFALIALAPVVMIRSRQQQNGSSGAAVEVGEDVSRSASSPQP